MALITSGSCALQVYGGIEHIDLSHNLMFSDSVFRLASAALGHNSLLSLDLSGRRLSKVTTAELRERCRRERCQFIFFDQPKPARPAASPEPEPGGAGEVDDALLVEVDWVVMVEESAGLDDIDDVKICKRKDLEELSSAGADRGRRRRGAADDSDTPLSEAPAAAAIRNHSFY